MRYRVHKRNWQEMETLVCYIYSVIGKEHIIIECEEIIDTWEHIPFLTQILEENNLTDVQFLRKKGIQL